MPSKNRIHVLPARPMPIATGTPITSVPKKMIEMTSEHHGSGGGRGLPKLGVDQNDHVVGEQQEPGGHGQRRSTRG